MDSLSNVPQNAAPTKRDLLLRLCDTGSGNSDGWAWATNGHVLIALDHGFEVPVYAGYLKPETYEGLPGRLRSWIGAISEGAWADVDLAELRRWAGCSGPCAKCGDSGKVRCGECGGRGRSLVTCDDCDESHDCRCSNCGGDGKATCRACDRRPEPALVVGALVNRSLLSLALRLFPDAGVARIAAGTQKGNPVLMLVAEREQLALMGMRDFSEGKTDESRPHFPPCAGECAGCAALVAKATA